MGKFIPVEPEKWAEMVRAQSEVERLKVEVERLTIALDNLDKKETRVIWIAVRLKSKVKELTIAGDDLVTLVDAMDVVMDMDRDHPEVAAWNKAKKERKP